MFAMRSTDAARDRGVRTVLAQTQLTLAKGFRQMYRPTAIYYMHLLHPAGVMKSDNSR
jgi:hypothetical protein